MTSTAILSGFDDNSINVRDRDMDKEQKVKIYEGFSDEMPGQKQQSFSIQEKLVFACKILGVNGHGENLAGQISVRSDEKPDCFITPRIGPGFGQVTIEDICLIDSEVNVIDSGHAVNPALRFHMWLYRARPDLRCLIHTHPPYASALSMTGQPLVVAHMDTAMFYNDCAYLAEWPGVPFSDDEGRIISEAIGDKKSILLAHHGILTTGASIEEATYLAVMLERAARLQLMAQSVGTIQEISPEHAQDARDFLLKPGIVNASFNAWAKDFIEY